MQDLSKHNSIKPCACARWPEFRAGFLGEESLGKVLFGFFKVSQKTNLYLCCHEVQPAGDCQSLESETDGEMGDGSVGQDSSGEQSFD